MRFSRSNYQNDTCAWLDGILNAETSSDRAREVLSTGSHDDHLNDVLSRAGLFSEDLIAEGILDRVLLTEVIGRHPAISDAANRLLLGEVLGSTTRPVPVVTHFQKPVRFGHRATAALHILGPTRSSVFELNPDASQDLGVHYCYPYATFSQRPEGSSREFLGSRPLMLWMLALCGESVGMMGTIIDMTVKYVKDREQFGRFLGSFQAVQQTLSQAWIDVEGARLLLYEAAWSEELSRVEVMTARVHTVAKSTIRSGHQFSGAMGLTIEYDLHLWTLRLRALMMEMLACLRCLHEVRRTVA